jgi:hypothetical protein
MPNDKVSRLRAEGRIRQRQQQERIDRGLVKVPTAEEANRKLGEELHHPRVDAAAALAALAADPDAGTTRMVAGHRANDLTPEPETDLERMDRWIDRVQVDPELEKTLTPQQRMSIGHRKAEREVEARIAEEDAANAGS